MEDLHWQNPDGHGISLTAPFTMCTGSHKTCVTHSTSLLLYGLTCSLIFQPSSQLSFPLARISQLSRPAHSEWKVWCHYKDTKILEYFRTRMSVQLSHVPVPWCDG